MVTYKRRLSISLLTGKGNGNLFKFLPPVKDYFLTESVRGGLEVLLNLMETGDTCKVLMPVFIAEGIVRPFKNNNINILFYRLNKDLSPDVDDIENQIVANTGIRFIVVVHYFGFPFNFKQVKEICKDNDIFLLEDCVHAMFSRDGGGSYLGITGDISFFSFPKILPVPDGAIFFINNKRLLEIRTRIKLRRSIAGLCMINLHLAFLILKGLEVKLSYSLQYRALNSVLKVLYGLYYALLNKCTKSQPVSKVTMKILKNINYDELIERRNNNARLICNVLTQEGNLRLLRECEPDMVLTGVPVISMNASQLVSVLRRRNVECLRYRKRWLFVPPGQMERYSNELDFYDHHFLFPVHEDDGNYIELLKDI